MKHYLVTGGQGFLGSRIVNALRKAGVAVSVTGRRSAPGIFKCDLTNAVDARRMIDQVTPDCIIHCAAHVPQTIEEYQDGSSADANLQLLNVVLSASHCPIVHISSMTVYGSEYDRQTREEDAGHATSAYGNSKWLAEQRLKSDGRPALAVRIPGLFGLPRRNGLVFNLLNALKYDTPPRLPDRAIMWAAMHVDDAATGIVKLALSGVTSFEAVNLGYRGVYSIKSLIDAAGDIYGQHIGYEVKQPTFEFDLTRAQLRQAVPESTLREALVVFGEQI